MSPIDTSFIPLRSRFDFGLGGDAQSLTVSLPSRAWDNVEESVGGRRIAAGRIGASYVVRTDTIMVVTLRFRESEWPTVLDMIRWGQTEETMVWYPDATDLGTSFVVWLHQPEAGKRVQATRLANYPKVMELTIELRRADAPETPWNLDYFGNL